jgi:hypothetical protein
MGQDLHSHKNQGADGQHEPNGQVAARPLSDLLPRLVDAGWILD